MKMSSSKIFLFTIFVFSWFFILSGCKHHDDNKNNIWAADLSVNLTDPASGVNGSPNGITEIIVTNNGGAKSDVLKHFSASILTPTNKAKAEVFNIINNNCMNHSLSPSNSCTFGIQAGTDGVASGERVRVSVESEFLGDSADNTFTVGSGGQLSFSFDNENLHLYYLGIKVTNTGTSSYTIGSDGTVAIQFIERKVGDTTNDITLCPPPSNLKNKNKNKSKGVIDCESGFASTCIKGVELAPNVTCYLWLRANIDPTADFINLSGTVTATVDKFTQSDMPITYSQRLYAGGEFGVSGDRNKAKDTIIHKHTLEMFMAGFDNNKPGFGLWSQIDSDMVDPSGENGEVASALALFEGDLYVGGEKYVSGVSIPASLTFKKWNGHEFTSVGNLYNSDAPSIINSLFVNPTDKRLYIGGKIDGLNGAPDPDDHVNSIVSWNGGPNFSDWDNVGFGLTYAKKLAHGSDRGIVYALNYYNNLIVGGNFDENKDGSVSDMNDIAAWDGSAWSKLANGLAPSSNVVYALQPYNSSLFAAGKISMPSVGSTTGNIIRWNGSNWDLSADLNVNCANTTKVGGICREEVYAMTTMLTNATHNNSKEPLTLLCVGGAFDTENVGTILSKSIACYDDVSEHWIPIKHGINNDDGIGDFTGVYALASNNGKLYIGGNFQNPVNTMPINKVNVEVPSYNNVIEYDGTDWQYLGGGISAYSVTGLDMPGVKALLIVPSISGQSQKNK